MMQGRLSRRGFILGAAVAPVVAPARAAGLVKVVVTFSILGDMAARIAGSHAQLTTIVGPDADCETYTTTAADARAVAEAQMFVMNDLNLRFEPWAETLLKRAAFRGTKLVATQGVNIIMDDRPQGAMKGPQIDHHAWQIGRAHV